MSSRTVRTPESTRRSATRRSPRGRARATKTTAIAGPLPVSLGVDFATSFGSSLAAGKRFVAELVDHTGKTSELVHWASVSGTSAQRRLIVAALKEQDAEILAIDGMSSLPRDQLGVFMKDYFDEGGNLDTIAEWLAAIGAVARERKSARSRKARTMSPRQRSIGGFFSKAWNDVKTGVEKAFDKVEEVASAVVDTVTDLGKSLGQIVSEAASFTASQLTDLAEGLFKAGRTVGEVLAAAATKGAAQLQKYVEAVLSAGRSVTEIVRWAATQAVSTANAAVAKLLQLGRSLRDVLESVIASGATALGNVVEAVLAAGKKMGDVLSAFAGEALAKVKPLVQALLSAGQTLRALLVEAAKLATSTVRTIAQALLDLGKSLTLVLVEAAGAVGDTLTTLTEALMVLGVGVTKILVAVAAEAASVVKAVVQALLGLGQTVAALVVAAIAQTVKVATAIFRALVAVGKKVADILLVLAGRAISALRTAVDALLAIGVELSRLVDDICTKVAAGCRRGFFEALVAVGKSLLDILKAAVEVAVAVPLLAFAVIMEMCGGYRGLETKERREAERIFGSSIDLERVQVGFAAFPEKVLNYVNVELPRAFTTMYLVNFGPGAVVDMTTIIHELAHVWQGVQAGPIYMTRALEAQMKAGLTSLWHTGKYVDDKAYEVTSTALAAARNDFGKFNPEQQASIVEDYWRQTSELGSTLGSDITVDMLKPYARQVFRPLKDAKRSAARKLKPARSRGRALTAHA